MQNLALISTFGLLGVLCRYGIDLLLLNWNEQLPVTTLIINLLGSFVAGAIYVVSEDREFPQALQLGLLVGFCGGFTTFSAYALQSFAMVERGKIVPALTYFLVSPVLGLGMVWLSVLITRRLLA